MSDPDPIELDDLVGPGTRLLFVGINPSMRSVADGAPFSSPSNRFWPALQRAGIVAPSIRPSPELSPADRREVIDRGIGITSLVRRATPSIADLSRDELRDAREGLAERVEGIAPVVVAILGVTGFRIAFRQPTAGLGPQPSPFGGSRLWVVPNPSGRNRSASLDALSEAYAAAAVAAGVELLRVAGA
ncbi:G/U mismatch-specific uracil-DNA glycosylase [Frondihabitans australicus]|uniref:G/U mismatch-specific uracil-DNA glycosylase n=2 Tax=Frondihabitans australicus TaxID=386892 RepID=A0A495IKZ5_9MICO|nr:G/U mismatch-specific uracil-DNA glycosylase [Frondihabitans australicus]